MSVESWGQACPELEYWTESIIFLSSGGFRSNARQALKGEAARPEIDSCWQVQLLGCLVEEHVAFLPALPVTSWVTILSLALLWQSGRFGGVRGGPLGSSYAQVSVHSLGGRVWC